MTDMKDVQALIERCYSMWSKWYGSLSVRISTKFVDGKDTGISSITFYVTKKEDKPFKLASDGKSGYVINKPMSIPKEIYGMPTDVVELSTPDFELGTTSVSSESPDEQRRKASGVKKNDS